MEIRQIKHFVAVADSLSFRRAAEAVNLSQQAVSKSVMQLERSLALKLLDRDRHSVQLTEQGKFALPYFREILAEIQRLEDALDDYSGTNSGILRIGSTPTFIDEVLPVTLREYSDQFPDSKLVVERGDFGILCDLLLQGKLDIFLSTEPSQTPSHLFETRSLAQDRNVAIVRAGHPLSHLKEVTVGDLLHYPMLATQNYLRGEQYLDRLFSEFGAPRPIPAMSVGSTVLAASWVQRSDYWWLGPYQLASRLEHEGKLAVLPLEPKDYSWNLIYVVRRNAQRSKWLLTFIKILQDYYARQH